MPLQLRTAVTDGLRLVFSRNGAVFVGLTAAAQLLSLLLVIVAASQQLPVASGVGGIAIADLPIGQSIPTATTALTVGLTSAFTAIITTPITVIMIRTFVDGVTDHIPDIHLFGHLGRATVRTLIAGLVIGAVLFGWVFCAFLVPTAMGLGSGFVVGQVGALPDWVGIIGGILIGAASFIMVIAVGLLLYVQLMFVIHEISVRNRSVSESLRGSWALARGHRLKLGLLSVLVIAVQSSVSSLATPSQFSDPSVAEAFRTSIPQLLLLPIGVILTAFISTLSAAVIARVYAELTAVDAVGGQRSHFHEGDDPATHQMEGGAEEPHDLETDSTA